MLLVRLRLPCILFHRNVAPEAVGVLRQAGRGGVLPLSHTQGLLAAQRDGWCGMLRDGPLRQGGRRSSPRKTHSPNKHSSPAGSVVPPIHLMLLGQPLGPHPHPRHRPARARMCPRRAPTCTDC